DADEPGSPRPLGVARRTLHRADERLLHEVVGVRGRARHAVAEIAEEALVLPERRLVVGPRAHAAARRLPRWRSSTAAARRPLARLASTSRPSRPTQSPTTQTFGMPGTSGPGRPAIPPRSAVGSACETTIVGRKRRSTTSARQPGCTRSRRPSSSRSSAPGSVAPPAGRYFATWTSAASPGARRATAEWTEK